ncbi:L-threonine 3-dehydrogenase [Streptantibioticus cattleyicolor]|uniref:L-threonine 3-dehydrogenase n=1 Tax=Streptantibioticus cattleyicolor (strain ATCC 35852 / DSM 46488 / JCM 4925 / NBRC 14057 / NRRL 8057) TaxID=1003195 RepID=F8JJ77_STREN|nr:L-threonine 3-dehydrogenase [Streptantibioticus cattleyicolor]AEW98814.1 L-threonine 3-dehydrogenase [Streptantibioticus cattleyicolor NRRL 8057 = DSM 46488]CCB72136.1 threonine 3-dehydrogenase [Streptantibioticus cattleyicolor NRRL 8057 = DSM 46488]
MKALVKAKAEPGLWLTDVPEPSPGPGDVLIKVLRTGICGTDLHIRAYDGWARQTVTTPLVVGHEFVGEVAATGADVADIAVGDLVSGEGHLVCGKCRNCLAGRRHLCRNTIGLGVGRDGAFAEYVVLPASNVWVHRGPVDLDTAAIFDPFGNAVHTALSFPLVGEDVLITGAGPIGIMAAAVARHAGARNVAITDVSDYRLELAEKVGVSLAVNVARESIEDGKRRLGLREGFDIGLEMSGRPEALRDMIANMTHGGRIAMLGLPSEEFPVDMARIVTSMITLKGIYGREMFETWYAMSVLLEGGLDLSPVITGRYSYRDFDAAFDDAAGGRCGKVILDWTA